MNSLHTRIHQETSVLVTGAAGFLGQHLVARLREMKHRVVATDLQDSSDIIPLDLLDKAGVEEAFKTAAPEIVVHLAAKVGNESSLEQPYDFYVNNLLGTLNVCDAAARYDVKKIVYLSSGAVYGNVGYEDLAIPFRTCTSSICYGFHNLIYFFIFHYNNHNIF